MKTCSRCGVAKPLDAFGRKGSGLRACCKVCHRAENAIDRQKHPERVKEAKARWCASPKKKAGDRAYSKAHAKELVEKTRRWRETNPERYVASNRALYLRQRDERRVKAAAYYERTAERAKARARAWREANPDAFRASMKARKARLRGGKGKVSGAEWSAILEWFDRRCAYCLAPLTAPTMDHVTPLSRGGAHEAPNVVPCCERCNKRKGPRGPLAMLSLPSCRATG